MSLRFSEVHIKLRKYEFNCSVYTMTASKRYESIYNFRSSLTEYCYILKPSHHIMLI